MSTSSEPRPWWDRALDPLRHEASMFRVLLWTLGTLTVVMAIVLVGRAVL